MRSLEEINQANGSDGKPMLDTHPGQTLGLPRPLKAYRTWKDTGEQEELKLADAKLKVAQFYGYTIDEINELIGSAGAIFQSLGAWYEFTDREPRKLGDPTAGARVVIP